MKIDGAQRPRKHMQPIKVLIWGGSPTHPWQSCKLQSTLALNILQCQFLRSTGDCSER